MKRTLFSVILLSTLLTACGGGSEDSSNEQPWLGDGSGDTGTTEQTPPTFVLMVPEDIGAHFNVEATFEFEANDADGDEISYGLVNNPSWVWIDGTTLHVKPNSLDGANNVQLVARDNDGETLSPTFDISVVPPSQISYHPTLPPSTSSGDLFTLTIRDVDGILLDEFAAEVSVDGEAEIHLPYPYTAIFDDTQAVLSWEHGEYVKLQRWIGETSQIYAELDESLSLPSKMSQSHMPTYVSSAYLHLLVQKQGDNSDDAVFTDLKLHELNSAVDASSLTLLSSYYQLAHQMGDLFALNSSLLEDYNTVRNVGTQTTNNLRSEVDDIINEALIHKTYWSDLINETSDDIKKDRAPEIGAGQYLLLEPVESRFSATQGAILAIDSTGNYTLSSSENIELDSSGVWEQGTDGDLLLISSAEEEAKLPQMVYLSSDGDEVKLRVDIVAELNVSHDTAEVWAKRAVDESLDSLSFRFLNQTGLSIHAVTPSGNGDIIGQIVSKGDVLFVETELTGEYTANLHDVLLRKAQTVQPSTFEFRNEIYDIIIPSVEDDGTFSSKDMWLELYYAPSVRIRSTNSYSPLYEGTDWTFSFNEDKNKFTFLNQNHPLGQAEYTIELTDTAAFDTSATGDTNSRRYSGLARITINDVLVEEKVIPWWLTPKSRCEDEARCDSQTLLQKDIVWTDSGLGYHSRSSRQRDNSFIAIDVPDPLNEEGESNTVTSLIEVSSTGFCYGDVKLCWRTLSSNFDIIHLPVYSGKWAHSAKGDWWPIKVNAHGFSVMTQESEVHHYYSTPSSSLMWQCSLDHPEVIKALGGDESSQTSLDGICIDTE